MGKVALVTGANQGLGLALVRALCRTLGADAHVYLAARNADRGTAAAEALYREGLEPIFTQLDVTSDASVAAAAAAIKERHGGLDIVVSNAGARITKEATPAAQVGAFIDTNNHGTYRVIRAFAPLLNADGRFLVAASGFGTLRKLDRRLWPLFDVASRTLEDIERTMDDYVTAVEQDRAENLGWPDWINIPSKIAQVASAKILARAFGGNAGLAGSGGDAPRGILVNAVCPGLVDTDASRPWFDDMSQAQAPDDAARDVIWLATLPPGTRTPHGELIQHRKIIPWT